MPPLLSSLLQGEELHLQYYFIAFEAFTQYNYPTYSTCYVSRGFMERVRYRVRLTKFREQVNLHKLMEEQYEKILKDHENSILKTFHAPELSEEEMEQEGM